MRPSIRNEVGPLLLLSHCKCYQIIRNIDLYCFIRQATAVRINSSALPGYLFSTICLYAVFAAFASCGNSHFRSTSRNVNTTSPTMHMHCSRAIVYDWATPLGRPPFCIWRVPASSERLHSQMWVHRFHIRSIYHMSGRNNMQYKYYRMCFGICPQSVWHFYLVASCATVH